MNEQLARRDLLRNTICGTAVICAGNTMSLAIPSSAYSAPREMQPERSFAVAAKRPRGLAFDGERCYVTADEGVIVYDETGKTLATWKFERPVRCLATRPKGEVLVGLAHRIERWSAEGQRLDQWATFNSEFLVQNLAVAGELTYVADSRGREVAQLDASGRIVRTIQLGKQSAVLPDVQGLAAQADGTFFVTIPSRHRVESYDREGRLIHVFGKKSRDLAGFSGCCNPVDLSLLADGNLVTIERGQPRVKVFSPRGDFLTLIAGPEQIPTMKAVNPDPANCIAGLNVATANNRIAILDQTQRQLYFFTS